MRDFFGDLVCDCDGVVFERIALTIPDTVMVVTHVLATCVSCQLILRTETDPHVDDLEPSAP